MINYANSENLGLHGFSGSIFKMSDAENGRSAKNMDFHNYVSDCHTFVIFTSRYILNCAKS